jgi:hypothetical protein
VLLMAFGWWGLRTLGSESLPATREPIYVAGCPLTDTLKKGLAGGTVQRRAHPIRSPHASLEPG